MKALSIFLVLTFLFSLGFAFFMEETNGGIENPDFKGSHTYNKGCRYNSQGWIFVHIEGEPYERGYQYGYLLSREIVDMINRWSHIIHNAPLIGPLTGNLSPSRYDAISQNWWNFCKSQIYTMYWNDYPLEYQDEIQGIAAGVTDNNGQVFGQAVTIEDILAINEMYEFITKLVTCHKSAHLLRTLFNNILQLVPELTTDDEARFISLFVNSSSAHHCTGFIATGDATTSGQIVATHATWFGSGCWWFNVYIVERWNVIVDLQPVQGNRLLFTTAPGYIWSDENYYQNQEGLVIIDTTAIQGLWAHRGVPLAVRSRMAAQYGGSIDEVISYLLNGNDGVWTAVWLIGDTKTGEIARMDLGLYNHGIWNTTDGFYWSANNIMDEQVRAERRLGTLKGRFFQLLSIVYPSINWYVGYYTREYHPTPRDIRFEELGNEFYGKIDVEWVKGIMSVSPFTNVSIETKVTDSYLIDQNGLWVHYGNPGGIIWNTTDLDDILPGGSVLPPLGWARIFGLPSNHDHAQLSNSGNNYGEPATLFWEKELHDENPENTRYAYSAAFKDIVYIVSSSGVVHAYNYSTGQQKWTTLLSGRPVGPPIVDNQLLVVGLSNNIYVLNRTTGMKHWNRHLKCVAPPVVIEDNLLVGCETQLVSLELISGNENWCLKTPAEAYPSNLWRNKVFIGTGWSCWKIDGDTGHINWSHEMDGLITAPPYVSPEGSVYVGSWNGSLCNLDADTGEKKWVFHMGWGMDSVLAKKGNTVFFGSMDNNFYAVNASNGETLWTFSCQGAVHSSPLIYGDQVFFGCDDGNFYALNITTGEPQWTFTPGYSLSDDIYNYVTTPIVGNAVSINGTVFLGAMGKIYALQA